MQPQRKILYIKKDFQLKFIIKFCLIIICGAVLSTAMLYYVSQDSITSTYHNSRLAIKTTNQVILPAILYTNLFNIIIVGVAAVFVTLYISHKIAGPLYRLETDLKSTSGGDLTRRFRLRQEDQLAELAKALNTFVASIDVKVSEVQRQADCVAQTAEAQGAPPEVLAQVNALRERIRGEFKTSPLA